MPGSARRRRGSSCGRTSSRRRRPRSRTASARPSTTGRDVVAVKVWIPGPDQTSEKPSASSTFPSQPVPSPCTKPSHSAAICASVIPGSMISLQCSIAAAAMSFASRMRSISCSVLTARASARSGVASSGFAERVEPVAREGRGLADHAVGRLGAEATARVPTRAVLGSALPCDVERASERRARVRRVVPGEEADVRCPGHALRVVLAGLEADEHRLALAREDADVVALHPPEVRQVEDVVGRADDERVQPAVAHQRAHAVELRVVARPGHACGASSHTTLSSRVTTRPIPEPG